MGKHFQCVNPFKFEWIPIPHWAFQEGGGGNPLVSFATVSPGPGTGPGTELALTEGTDEPVNEHW